MSNIKSLHFEFRPPADTDVEGYNIYAKPASEGPIDILNEDPIANIVSPPVSLEGYVRIDISTLPGMAGADAIFNFAFTAYDEVGNESMPLLDQHSVDFIAPGAPSDGRWVVQ